MRIIYNSGLLVKDWESGVFRVLLVRSTSTYVPNRDHATLNQFFSNGGVEVDVAGYERQTIANAAEAVNNADDRIDLDADDVEFGELPSGQSVLAVLCYRQVGGDDSTPNDDELVFYDDGRISVTLAAAAAGSATTIYVDPLSADLRSGTELDFGGGATCALSAAASKGARTLSVTALGDAAAAGAVSTEVESTMVLAGFGVLAILQNGAVEFRVSPDGVINFQQRN